MITAQDAKVWINSLEDSHKLSIDESGLILVEFDQDGKQTGKYLEIGNAPQEESDDPDDAPKLTDEWFRRADAYIGDQLIRKGDPN